MKFINRFILEEYFAIQKIKADTGIWYTSVVDIAILVHSNGTKKKKPREIQEVLKSSKFSDSRYG
jgi:hypothetical protein